MQVVEDLASEHGEARDHSPAHERGAQRRPVPLGPVHVPGETQEDGQQPRRVEDDQQRQQRR